MEIFLKYMLYLFVYIYIINIYSIHAYIMQTKTFILDDLLNHLRAKIFANMNNFTYFFKYFNFTE